MTFKIVCLAKSTMHHDTASAPMAVWLLISYSLTPPTCMHAKVGCAVQRCLILHMSMLCGPGHCDHGVGKPFLWFKKTSLPVCISAAKGQ